jgi:hypothetical protein
MKKQYDFSKGVRGKYFIPKDEINLPIFLDKKVRDFFLKQSGGASKVSKIVNSVMKKEMEIIKELGIH